MLTKNFYNLVLMKCFKKTIENGATKTDGSVADIVYTTSNHADKLLDSLHYRSSNTYGTRFGTGNTPATIDDYMLESEITSGVSIAYPNSTSLSIDADGSSCIAAFSVTNTGSEALPISEIGYIAQVYTGTSSSSTGLVLLDRTVLDEPITINPGETKQLTYTIRMNYPTA